MSRIQRIGYIGCLILFRSAHINYIFIDSNFGKKSSPSINYGNLLNYRLDSAIFPAHLLVILKSMTILEGVHVPKFLQVFQSHNSERNVIDEFTKETISLSSQVGFLRITDKKNIFANETNSGWNSISVFSEEKTESSSPQFSNSLIGVKHHLTVMKPRLSLGDGGDCLF